MLSINQLTVFLGLAVFITATPGSAGVITLTNNTPANLDNNSVARTFNITPATAGFGSGIITDVNIAANFMKADGEVFTEPGDGIPYFNEIVFRLVAPSGSSVDLIVEGSFNNGERGTYFDGTLTFDQSASQAVNVDRDLMVPGVFRPVQSLNALNGSSAEGTFTLFVQDLDTADSLRLRSATLTVTTTDALEPVPEPTSLLLGTTGILGIVGRRWYLRRRGQRA